MDAAGGVEDLDAAAGEGAPGREGEARREEAVQEDAMVVGAARTVRESQGTDHASLRR